MTDKTECTSEVQKIANAIFKALLKISTKAAEDRDEPIDAVNVILNMHTLAEGIITELLILVNEAQHRMLDQSEGKYDDKTLEDLK